MMDDLSVADKVLLMVFLVLRDDGGLMHVEKRREQEMW